MSLYSFTQSDWAESFMHFRQDLDTGHKLRLSLEPRIF